MKPLWLHVGLAKTATTTLQRMLFSRHPQVGYLGKNWVDNDAAKSALMHLARSPERHVDLHEIASAFDELIRRYSADEQRRICLVSEEDLTTFRFINPKLCARRAKVVFPHARVLLVIREPIEWLQSMYFFRLSLRFPETLDGFNAWLKSGIDSDFVRSDLGQIQIGTLLDIYVDFFGPENLTVLRYEDFAADTADFVEELSTLLGIDGKIAIALIQEKGRLGVRKLRITEAQKSFLEKYKLVVLGRYREYLAEIAPLVAGLGKKAKLRAAEMLQVDLDADKSVVEAKLKALSIFLERECRDQFQSERKASAELDHDLRKRVMEIWEPGARRIAAHYNTRVNDYFSCSARVQ